MFKHAQILRSAQAPRSSAAASSTQAAAATSQPSGVLVGTGARSHIALSYAALIVFATGAVTLVQDTYFHHRFTDTDKAFLIGVIAFLLGLALPFFGIVVAGSPYTDAPPPSASPPAQTPPLLPLPQQNVPQAPVDTTATFTATQPVQSDNTSQESPQPRAVMQAQTTECIPASTTVEQFGRDAVQRLQQVRAPVAATVKVRCVPATATAANAPQAMPPVNVSVDTPVGGADAVEPFQHRPLAEV